MPVLVPLDYRELGFAPIPKDEIKHRITPLDSTAFQSGFRNPPNNQRRHQGEKKQRRAHHEGSEVRQRKEKGCARKRGGKPRAAQVNPKPVGSVEINARRPEIHSIKFEKLSKNH